MSKNDIQEIKNRLDIVDVISEYIQLKKSGANYKALCPFHNEKTPSFFVSPDKQIWHCFGCGKGGDIFTFVKEYNNFEFIDALKLLAQKAGVSLSSKNRKKQTQRNVFLEIMSLSNKFFQYCLWKSKSAKAVQDYLQKRDINKEMIKKFNLGYSLNSWDSLMKFLIKKGFSQKQILQTGMIIQKSENKFYDRFRNRLMFPIHNLNGEVIAFAGRVLDGDEKTAKYINSPQTVLYNKSAVIYGLYQARQAIREKNFVIVVEGYFDVISNHKIGIENVIAVSGTAFTKEQVNILKRYTSNLVFCFDNDSAGQSALLRSIELALEADFNIYVISLPQHAGKDPDECIRKNPELWKDLIKKKKNFIQFYIDKFLDKYLSANPQEQAEIVKELLKVVSFIKDTLKRDFWLKKISQVFDIDFQTLQENVREVLLNKKINIEGTDKKFSFDKQFFNPEYKFFGILILYTRIFFQNFKNIFNEEVLFDNNLQKLYKCLIVYYNSKKDFYNENEELDYQDFIDWLYKEPHQISGEAFEVGKIFKKEILENLFNKLYIFSKDKFGELNEREVKKEFEVIIRILQRNFAKQRLQYVSNLLDKETDEKKLLQLKEEYNKLVKFL